MGSSALCSVWLLLLLSMSVSPTAPHLEALLCQESGLSWALAHKAAGVEGLSQVTSAGWEPGSSMAGAGPLEVISPLLQGLRAEEHGPAHTVGEGIQPGAGFRDTHPASSRTQTRSGMGRWTWPGAGLGDPILGLQDPGPAWFLHQRLWGASTLLSCGTVDRLSNSCPRGNGFSLNL